MNTKQPLILATSNPGKITEIKALLTDFPVQIKTLSDFGPIPPIVEDGLTFDENAYKKASVTARILGLPTLADDSGLLIDALDGAPGIYSARFAGEGADDHERCNLILAKMKGLQNRKAAFKCVISIAVPSGAALTYEGHCKGLIAEHPSGKSGFGYDPLFYYPAMKKTFAQLTRQEKGKVSHRGKALWELKQEFDKVLIWIGQHMPKPPRVNCLGKGACDTY